MMIVFHFFYSPKSLHLILEKMPQKHVPLH